MGKAANGHAMQVGGIPAFRQSTPKCLFFGQSDKIGPALEAREAVFRRGPLPCYPPNRSEIRFKVQNAWALRKRTPPAAGDPEGRFTSEKSTGTRRVSRTLLSVTVIRRTRVLGSRYLMACLIRASRQNRKSRTFRPITPAMRTKRASAKTYVTS